MVTIEAAVDAGMVCESRQCAQCRGDYLYPFYGGQRVCHQCLWGHKLDGRI